jgi:hypothetical protein
MKLTISYKLKLCFEILKAKHEKELSLFIKGYDAGLKDGYLETLIK